VGRCHEETCDIGSNTVEPAALKLSSASSARRERTLQNRRKP